MGSSQNWWQTERALLNLLQLKTKYPKESKKIFGIPSLATLRSVKKNHDAAVDFERRHREMIEKKWARYGEKNKKKEGEIRQAASEARATLREHFPEIYEDIFGNEDK